MGICLGTEQDNTDTDAGKDVWLIEDETEQIHLTKNTPPGGQLSMSNTGKITFEKPKVPVIFVLGGPASGRITHVDRFVSEHPGVVHINMLELLQQYQLSTDNINVALVSSKVLTETLMLEMKLTSNSTTYLITGYPRNMRDAVEYSQKLQELTGVILLSWRQKILEKQIDYGAKLGKLVLPIAKMEFDNFFRNTLPVVDFYDQNGILIMVNGERYPSEVYKDFRKAVNRIVSNFEKNKYATNFQVNVPIKSNTELNDKPENVLKLPKIIWVIGAPGSNKSQLCHNAIQKHEGWTFVNLGNRLRTKAEYEDVTVTKTVIARGHLVVDEIVTDILDSELSANINSNGIIICGFPRNLNQMEYFELQYEQKPHLILLDYSNLQLGRGRLDDNVAAFRRKLETFREITSQMLRKLDTLGRLTIINGNTNTKATRRKFEREVDRLIRHNDVIETHVEPEPEPEPEPVIDDIVKQTNLKLNSIGFISKNLTSMLRNMKQNTNNNSRIAPEKNHEDSNLVAGSFI